MKNLQYISDSTGQIAGVFIPIEEWNELKEKYQDIETDHTNIPTWHIKEVRKRLDEYEANPDIALDFDAVIDELEKSL